jgi:hypothetical protein
MDLKFDCFELDDKEETKDSKVEILPEHFQFEILLDHKYPFSQPQIFCQTRFTNVIDLYDGRDLYTDILNGEEWRIARNLHEIISCLPEFIQSSKLAEEAALEQHEIEEASSLLSEGNTKSTLLTEVFGRYHLETVYDITHFKNKYAKTCKVFKCQEQDELDPENTFHERQLVITKTCLLIFSPVKQEQVQLEFWATLQSLERIRRNLNCPNIVAC